MKLRVKYGYEDVMWVEEEMVLDVPDEWTELDREDMRYELAERLQEECQIRDEFIHPEAQVVEWATVPTN